MYKKGLVSISFRKLSCDEIIHIAKEAGLEAIEWGSDVHAPADNSEKLLYIAAKMKAAGLECCSYGTYFRLGVTPISELEEYITAAKTLCTNILRLWCGDKGSSEYSKPEKEHLLDECKKAAELAEKHSVTLCLECHNNTYTDRLDGASEVMKAVNSPHLRMYWQPNQYRSEDENLHYARNIAPYTEHIHVFNWLEDARFPLAEAGETWLRYLKELSGDHYLLLEFMPDDRPESLPAEAEALKNIAAEAEQ